MDPPLLQATVPFKLLLGGIAFDSDKWGGYQGGNVTLENGQVIGNVNATNGGKISLNGGTVTGDVIASNYTYQGNEKLLQIL